jgi:hypothetical protein
MSNNREKLCDLIETRSALHCVTRLKLWRLVFAAVLDGQLEPAWSDDVPPDPNNHEMLRALIAGVHLVISGDPASWPWVRRVVISPVAFDKWLKGALHDLQFPASPKRRAGAKPVLIVLKEFIDETYPKGVPPGITNKDIAEAAKERVGKTVSERTVRRARGHK